MAWRIDHASGHGCTSYRLAYNWYYALCIIPCLNTISFLLLLETSIILKARPTLSLPLCSSKATQHEVPHHFPHGATVVYYCDRLADLYTE